MTTGDTSMQSIVKITAVLLLAGTTVTAQESAWKAGVAAAAITPENPMWMAGYAARTRPSEGSVHDLHVKALALEHPSGRRMVFLTSDLISVPGPVRAYVVRQVTEKLGLPPECLMMNCSHTHCGPEIRTSRWSLDGLPADRLKTATDYVAFLQQKMVSVIETAISRLQPSRVSYCRARCGFAMNRRTPSATGFRNFPNADGPVDHDVPVLKIQSPDGKELRAVMFGYACHNTTLGFYQFCGDYAGFAQQYLEEAHPGATALFVLGCGGDQNPYPRRTLELAQQHGRSLANAVETALLTTDRPLSGPLTARMKTAELYYVAPPTKEQLMQKAASTDKYDRRHAERLLQQLEETGGLTMSYKAPVQTVQLGDHLTMVALPGETVVDYSLRLKAELSDEHSSSAIWVAGYSNNVFAYIPSRRVLLEGGYEAGGAMRYMTTVLQHGPFREDVEEILISAIHELMRD